MKERATTWLSFAIGAGSLLAGCDARAISALEATAADSGVTRFDATVAPSASQCPPIPDIAPEDDPAACGPPIAALIDDFEGGFPPIWIPFDDGTGARDFSIEAGGPLASGYAAHLVGDGFTQWGAGVAATFTCLTDARSYEGMSFHVRAAAGPGRFFVQVTMPQTIDAMFGGLCLENCSDHYTFTPKISVPGDAWYACQVRFADLTQFGFSTPVALDLCRTSSIQFLFSETDQPIDAWFDDLAFAPSVAATGCTPLAIADE